MHKYAKDLGNKNLPRIFVQQAVPEKLKALWWREESINPNMHTVEIWSSESDIFYVVFGDFSSKEWGYDDIQLLSEHGSIDEALQAAKSNFIIKEDEQPNEQIASNSFKRLIKRN